MDASLKTLMFLNLKELDAYIAQNVASHPLTSASQKPSQPANIIKATARFSGRRVLGQL